MKSKSFFCFIAVILVSVVALPAFGQSQFVKALGGTGDDIGWCVVEVSDGGFVIAGYQNSFGAGDNDAFLTKFDASGDTVWTRTLGGSDIDLVYFVVEVSDGGLVITGETVSYTGGGSHDLLLAKFDGSGNHLWTTTLGGTGTDQGFSVVEVSDGGLVVSGENYISGRGLDLLLAKFDASGDTVWTTTLGGGSRDQGFSVVEVSDGGFVVTGKTQSFGAGGHDILLAKFDASGDTVWTRTLGGTGDDHGWSVVEVSDGGFVITGHTGSYGAGGWDIFLAKFDASGDTVWTRTLGGTGEEWAHSVVEVSDGGLVVTGYTDSYGAGVRDLLLAKFDGSGNHLWTWVLGGTGTDIGYSVVEASDGGLVVTGSTQSYGAGNWDILLAKFDANGNTCLGEFVTPEIDSVSPTITTPSPIVTTPELTITSLEDPTVTSPTPTTTVVCEGGNQPPTAFIDDISPNPAEEGEEVTFVGHGEDTDGSIVAYNWRSSIAGTLSTDSSFSTSNLSVGTHTIYLEVQDDDSTWSEEVTDTLEIKGLVAYWSFDEGSGDTAYDYSGNGNHGIIHGATWTTGPGGCGSALRFEGGSGIRDHVVCPDDPFDLAELTISVWAKPDTVGPHDDRIVCKLFQYSILGENMPSKRIRVISYNTNGGLYLDAHTDSSFTDTTRWYHIVGVFTEDSVVAYLNGRLAGMDNSSDGTLRTSGTENLWISGHSAGWDCFFGIIDEVYIFNRALNEAEIESLYNQCAPNQPPTLSWAGDPGYETDGVSPDEGLSTSMFTYRVVYTDADNDPPKFGYPKVELDMNGDGDLNDPNEGSFSMAPTHPDNDYTDGREYYFPTYLPVGSNHQYRFVAQDTSGAQATGAPTSFHSGPQVTDYTTGYDLYIYANDISFSEDNPGVGEQVSLYATVHNNSFEGLQDVPVIFYVDEVVVDTISIVSISAYGEATVGIDYQFNQMGFYGIRARVLAPSGIQEWDESNNDAVRGILVGDYAYPGQLVLEGTCTDSIYTNGQVVISGNVQYAEVTVPGPLQGGTVTMSILGTDRQATGYTDNNGDYWVTCQAPSEPGTYIIRVEATDYTISTQENYQLFVASTQYGPDVAIDVTPSDGYNFLPGQTFSLSTEVWNQGDMTADSITTWLTQDGESLYTYQPPIDSLLPAEHKDLQPDINTSFNTIGTHYITGHATIPPGDLNPGNNAKLLTFRVWPDSVDLVPTDISFSDHSPYTTQQINITVRVGNQGGIDCSDSPKVLLTANDDTIALLTCPPIPGFGGTKYISTVVSFAEDTTYKITAFVDPDNQIPECNETNNEYSEYLTVHAPCPDFQVDYYDLTVEPDTFQLGISVDVWANIHNLGEPPQDSVGVIFGVGNDTLGSERRVYFGQNDLLMVKAAEQFTVTADSQDLWVEVDPEDQYQELNENNNSATVPLPLDFTPAPSGVYYPKQAIKGLPTEVTGWVRNMGGFDADTVLVGYYELSGGDTNLIWTDTVSGLEDHGVTDPTTLVFLSNQAGLDTILVWVDPNSLWPEYTRTNNQTTFEITVSDSLPDLVVQSDWLNFEPFNPDTSESVRLAATIYNLGFVPAQDVQVLVTVDSTVIDTAYFSSIPATGHKSFDSLYWIARGPVHQGHIYKVDVDFDDLMAELNEDNNQATREIVVGKAPNLYLQSSDIRFLKGDWQWSDSLIVRVRVHNNGGAQGQALTTVYYENHTGGTDTIGYHTITVPPAGTISGVDSVDIRWYGAQDSVEVIAKLTDCVPEEITENDNVASRFFCADSIEEVGIPQRTSRSAEPETYSLFQNYPNPFNPVTRIKYALPKDCNVKLTIYNILGQRVITLVNERQTVGYKIVHWDSRNQSGNEVTSGIYFYRLQAGDFVQTRKMILLK